MDVGAGGRGGADVGGFAHLVEHDLGELVDFVEVGAHALRHDVGGDVDHVRVAHAPAVDDIGHLHAGAQLVLLDLDGEDGHLRRLHVFEHGLGHAVERARRELFEHERVPLAAGRFKLERDGSSNGEAGAIGDERDLLGALHLQAGRDGVARAFAELRRERHVEEVGFDGAVLDFSHLHPSRVPGLG